MVGLSYRCIDKQRMTIFDIDERINDPWAGLRKTDAYIDYVLEEVQRLYDSGELEEVSGEVFMGYVFGILSERKPSTGFLFDGREFTYLYYRDRIVVWCEEWENAKRFDCKDGKITYDCR